MIALPPSLTGAIQETVTCESPKTPTTPVGASGATTTPTERESDGAPEPALLMATTVNVYRL